MEVYFEKSKIAFDTLVFVECVLRTCCYISLSVWIYYGGKVTWEKLLIWPITNGHQFIYNLGGWFVIPLFMVQVYNVIVRRLFGSKLNEYCFFALNLCLGIIGVYIAANGLNTDWWLVLVRMLYFIPFYEFGILYKRKLEKWDKWSSLMYFSIIFIIELIIIYIYGKAPAYTPAWFNNFVDGPILPFIVGFLGIAFWLRVSKLLEPVIGRNKYINLIADNTYSIMINQFAGFMIVKTIFALINKYTPYCSNFNWEGYKTDIWYYYVPHGIYQMHILYLVAGIAFPIMFQLILNKAWDYFKCKYRKLVRKTKSSVDY